MIAPRPARALLLCAVVAFPACQAGPKATAPPPTTPQDAVRAALRQGDAAQALSLAERLGIPERSAREVFQYEQGWGMPSVEDQAEIRALMAKGFGGGSSGH